MKITTVANIEGAFILDRENLFRDERGNFQELHRDEWPYLPKFVQRNQSFSFYNVLRGMHTQSVAPQGKLITVSHGKIIDVIFDVRCDSPTFMQGFSMTLTNFGESLYVPPGCLHGFFVISQTALVQYDCTTYYNAINDGGVNWNDEKIRGLFPSGISPSISDKDRKLPTLDQYLEGLK